MICKKCKIDLAIESFKKDRYFKKDGSQSILTTCKKCQKNSGLEYRKKNKEESKAYKELNKEKISKQGKEYYKNKREKILEYQTEYRKNNSKKISTYKKQYHQRKDFKAKKNDRYHTDPSYKISVLLRCSFRSAVKRGSKKVSVLNLLGCSILDFKKYIENQFKLGMSWDKWGNGKGKFHLDHIKPISSFDLTIYSQQAECFHYTNYQPLWSHDNWAKCDWVTTPDGHKVHARYLKKY